MKWAMKFFTMFLKRKLLANHEKKINKLKPLIEEI